MKELLIQIVSSEAFAQIVVGALVTFAAWLVKNKHVSEKNIAIAKKIYMSGGSATDVTDRTRFLIGEALDMKKRIANQPEKNLINKLIGLLKVLLRGWIK